MLESWLDRGFPGRHAAGSALLCAALLTGCDERDRLLILGPGDGVGPETVIDQPGRDTTITAGNAVIVAAYSRDPDGLDTVYFRTFGPGPSFQPFIPDEGADSVRVGVPIGTSGLGNDTIIVMIFATDLRGNRGDTAVRALYIP